MTKGLRELQNLRCSGVGVARWTNARARAIERSSGSRAMRQRGRQTDVTKGYSINDRRGRSYEWTVPSDYYNALMRSTPSTAEEYSYVSYPFRTVDVDGPIIKGVIRAIFALGENGRVLHTVDVHASISGPCGAACRDVIGAAMESLATINEVAVRGDKPRVHYYRGDARTAFAIYMAQCKAAEMGNRYFCFHVEGRVVSRIGRSPGTCERIHDDILTHGIVAASEYQCYAFDVEL